MAGDPGKWRWSSHRAMIGKAKPPSWLASDALLAHFGPDRATAVRRYRRFVAEGMDAESIWSNLNRQVFLGDDAFVARVQPVLRDGASDISIPKAQQRPPVPPLEEIAAHYPTRDAAIAAAHATYSYQQIGEAFGLHFTTVGRIVRAARKVGTL
jgi:hypothetical protein